MKKMPFIPCVSTVVVAAVCLCNPTAFAGEFSQLDAAKKQLRASKAAEMPAKASQVVSQAKAEDREATAETVVSAANSVRPTAILAVVGAISRDNPAVAAAVAGHAARLRPSEAAAIARATAVACPGHAIKIVHDVCKAAPRDYSAVATAVTKSVSGLNNEQVWSAVTAAIPSLKTTTASTTPTDVGALPPPTFGPPFTGVAPIPNEIDRNDTTEVRPGGGGYGGP